MTLGYTTFRFTAHDGTSLLGWHNDGEGPPVVVSNGLGVPPEAWPRLLDPDCGYRVYGWNHRGVMGSDRPRDLERIRVEDHADDAIALMDHLGLTSAIFVAWSIGVNVSVEVAQREPDRVAGMLMCAGVPGATLESAFAPLMVPKPLRKPLSLAVARTGKAIGGPLTALARVVPKGEPLAFFLRQSRLVMPWARHEDLVPWLESFARHDFGWYFHLFPKAGEHERVDPSFIRCPITVAAGGWDTLTSMRDVVAFAEQIEHAEVHVLHGTHLIPLEFPDEIMSMLDGVLMRSALADQRRAEPRPSTIDVRDFDGHVLHEHRAEPPEARERTTKPVGP